MANKVRDKKTAKNNNNKPNNIVAKSDTKKKEKRKQEKKMSIPLKVLYDALGMVVSLEVTNGEVYHGTLTELQDTMNVLLTDASKTSQSGRVTKMESVLVRGATIVFFELPDRLLSSPALVTAGKVVPKALDGRGEGKGFGARADRDRETKRSKTEPK